MALGMIDWGIGGVGVYKLIKQMRPDVPVIYLSDTGATPYGKMTRDDLVNRLNAVIDFLRSRGVTHVVIGCNAASTAIPHLKTDGLRVEGVIDTAVAMVARMKPRRLGLIGGRRTVLSGVYRDAFADRGIAVEQRIAQPLSALIESGDTGSDKLRGECRRIIAPLKNCSHILLACTHYPAISPLLKEYVSSRTTLIDPAETLARNVARWKIDGNGGDVFLTTGDTSAMRRAARAAFGCELSNVKKISIAE